MLSKKVITLTILALSWSQMSALDAALRRAEQAGADDERGAICCQVCCCVGTCSCCVVDCSPLACIVACLRWPFRNCCRPQPEVIQHPFAGLYGPGAGFAAMDKSNDEFANLDGRDRAFFASSSGSNFNVAKTGSDE